MRFKLPQFQFRNEYFLFLLPLFFVFHGYAEHYPFIPALQTFILFLKYFGVISLISLLFFLLFRSWKKSAVFTFLLMCFYFFFGTVHDEMKKWLGEIFLVKYIFILPFSLLVLLFLFIFLKKSSHSFKRFSKYINVLLLVLLLVDAGILLFKNNRKQEVNLLPQNLKRCDTCSKPDIYFIVADEYAGRKELKDIFSFDNSPFEEALKQKGFHVIDSSVSNYNYTPFCMASTLQMEYLENIEGRNKSKKDRKLCNDLINKNQLLQFLKAHNYQILNHSLFHIDNLPPPVGSTSFTLAGVDLLTSQTFFSRVNRDIRFNTISRFKLKGEMQKIADEALNDTRIIYQKTKEAASNNTNKPRFIYSHLMMPHYPYFFNKEGKPYPLETLMEGNQARKDAYIEYLQYCNKQFLDLIDHILKKSTTPPVIIFMGDHGFRHFNEKVDSKYHFMNINSIYLPNRNYDNFYNGMSSVNEFRVLLNTLFNQQLPLLKDSTSFLQE